MYIPGRLRTASRPSRTWMADASYSTPLGGSGIAAAGTDSGTDGSGVSSLTRTSSSGSGRPEGHLRPGADMDRAACTRARGLDVHDSRFRAALHAYTLGVGASVDEIRPQTAREG